MKYQSYQPYHPSPSVFLVSCGSQTILLDTWQGTVFGFNQTATRIWTMLSDGETPPTIAEWFVTNQNGDLQQVQTDLSCLITRWLTQRLLLVHTARSTLSPRFSRLDRTVLEAVRLEAFVTLIRTNHLLHQPDGLVHLARHLQEYPGNRIVTGEDEQVTSLAGQVQATAQWQRFPARCLHQSIAHCWMLRRRGIRADFVIGVYTHPFSCHVWEVCHDEIIQWEAGMGAYPDPRRMQEMSILFHSRHVGEGGLP